MSLDTAPRHTASNEDACIDSMRKFFEAVAKEHGLRIDTVICSDEHKELLGTLLRVDFHDLGMGSVSGRAAFAKAVDLKLGRQHRPRIPADVLVSTKDWISAGCLELDAANA